MEKKEVEEKKNLREERRNRFIRFNAIFLRFPLLFASVCTFEKSKNFGMKQDYAAFEVLFWNHQGIIEL